MANSKEAFEATGLIPRSIIRTVDRFLQQLLPGREKVAIQEYRVSRYQILVSIKALFTLICIPLLLSYTLKSFFLTPLIEYFWNSSQSEIFLNQYQEKRAFAEMHDFSEKLFFELFSDSLPCIKPNPSLRACSYLKSADQSSLPGALVNRVEFQKQTVPDLFSSCCTHPTTKSFAKEKDLVVRKSLQSFVGSADCDCFSKGNSNAFSESFLDFPYFSNAQLEKHFCKAFSYRLAAISKLAAVESLQREASLATCTCRTSLSYRQAYYRCKLAKAGRLTPKKINKSKLSQDPSTEMHFVEVQKEGLPYSFNFNLSEQAYKKAFQMKSLQLAKKYNKQSILAITNLLGDFVTFVTLYFLFRVMRPEIIILKSFITESVYSLSDTTKSFLLILGMDLLVGFHSPRAWEIALEAFLRHIGLPENENFILLFVALFPVFLDTVFKYWIFRYLNKISPSTVVTYHSMIE